MRNLPHNRELHVAVIGNPFGVTYDKGCSIKGDVKNIFLPPPEARIRSAMIQPHSPGTGFCGVVPRDCYC
jgi:hypothetical protein